MTCEICGKQISYKMAKASETYSTNEGQALCLACQIKKLDLAVENGRYPEKLAQVRKKQLQKYLK